MEDNGAPHFDFTVRKKRSLSSRRPRPQRSIILDHFFNISSDDELPAFGTNPSRNCISRADSQRENKPSSEGAPARWKSTSRDDEGIDMTNGKGVETKRMKLKIGGVTHLLHLNASSPRVKAVDLGEVKGETKRMKLKIGGVTHLLHPNASSPGVKGAALGELEGGTKRMKIKTGGVTHLVHPNASSPTPRVNDTTYNILEESSDDLEGEETMTERRSPETRVMDRDDDYEEVLQFLEELRYRKFAGCNEETESGNGEKSTGKKKTAAEDMDYVEEPDEKESEEEAIRKKREDENKKRLNELAKEKAAHEERVSTEYIRTIIGPNGTTVSFPIDKVPSLFDSRPSVYPPPKENCAGPSCTNPYKYRHSKTNAPLCSLKCYNAIQGQQQPPPP